MPLIVLFAALFFFKTEPPNNLNEFQVVNEVFRDAYKTCKHQTLKREINPYPVMSIDEGKHLIRFYKQGQDLISDRGRCDSRYCTLKEYTPKEFEHIKVVAHVPVAMYLIIETQSLKEGQIHSIPLDQSTLNKLYDLDRLATSKMRHSIETGDFNIHDKNQLLEIIDSTSIFIQQISENGTLHTNQLKDFFHKSTPLLMDVTAKAAELGLRSFIATVNEWKTHLTDRQWNNTHVLVHCGDTSRKDNMEGTAIEAMLGEERGGSRVIYDENGVDDVTLLERAAHLKTDINLSEMVFNEKWRMHRDVLGDATKEILSRKLACPHAVQFFKKLK